MMPSGSCGRDWIAAKGGRRFVQRAGQDVLWENGWREKVLEYLDKAREADPTLLQTYYNAAAVMLAQGKSEDALGQYDLALAVQPLDVRALIGAPRSSWMVRARWTPREDAWKSPVGTWARF